MKKQWLLITAVGLLLAAMLVSSNTKSRTIKQVLRDQQTLLAHAQQCMEQPDAELSYGEWKTGYSSRYHVVRFQVSYRGFGSQFDETGVYYAPDDQICGFGNDLGEEPSEDGVKLLGEGDNYTYVERIAAHWYWYEIHW